MGWSLQRRIIWVNYAPETSRGYGISLYSWSSCFKCFSESLARNNAYTQLCLVVEFFAILLQNTQWCNVRKLSVNISRSTLAHETCNVVPPSPHFTPAKFCIIVKYNISAVRDRIYRNKVGVKLFLSSILYFSTGKTRVYHGTHSFLGC